MCDNIYQMHLKRHKGLGDSIFILLSHVDGLVEDCSISTVKALEVLQSGTKPLMSYYGIVQYSMIVSTPVWWLKESIGHALDSKNKSHTLATGWTRRWSCKNFRQKALVMISIHYIMPCTQKSWPYTSLNAIEYHRGRFMLAMHKV